MVAEHEQRGIAERVDTVAELGHADVEEVGANLGRIVPEPETILGQYDVVFAKGRCAWEAMACGVAVVVCDTWGIGPLVTRQAPGSPVTRARPSAMKAAACSWRTLTYSMALSS